MRDLVEIILWVLSNFINVFKIIFNVYTVLGIHYGIVYIVSAFISRGHFRIYLYFITL